MRHGRFLSVLPLVAAAAAGSSSVCAMAVRWWEWGWGLADAGVRYYLFCWLKPGLATY